MSQEIVPFGIDMLVAPTDEEGFVQFHINRIVMVDNLSAFEIGRSIDAIMSVSNKGRTGDQLQEIASKIGHSVDWVALRLRYYRSYVDKNELLNSIVHFTSFQAQLKLGAAKDVKTAVAEAVKVNEADVRVTAKVAEGIASGKTAEEVITAEKLKKEHPEIVAEIREGWRYVDQEAEEKAEKERIDRRNAMVEAHEKKEKGLQDSLDKATKKSERERLKKEIKDTKAAWKEEKEKHDLESAERVREQNMAQNYLRWTTVQAHLESVFHDIAMQWPTLDTLQLFKENDWHAVSFMKQGGQELLRRIDELEQYRYGTVDADVQQGELLDTELAQIDEARIVDAV